MNSLITIREADPTGPDAPVISALLRAYLQQTEREKRVHAGEDAPENLDVTVLPEKYQREVDQPAVALANSRILLAEKLGRPVGIVVLHPGDGATVPGGDATDTEIKRLWVSPEHRGGVGRALLDSALSEVHGAALLSVWDWRHDAIGLYKRLGFVSIPSRDGRPRLEWLRRAAR
ncbi:GNAT family N-acetyltransferase [Mycetocola saprophilus]|uniref:GNAT family N-acetyltransferase n=1 Tax=Mycetocola saprophilus TaxID=76636 RepID=UPI0004BF3CD7|nr:GNAT family N-acetyltransferase [Mycetocola saprophilus]